MRISLVQDHLRMGGTERQSVLLANAFATAGHETQLLTFRPGGPLTPHVSPLVQHVVLQSRDREVDWYAPGLKSALRSARPDIVQLMGRTAQIVGWNLPRALPAARFVATFRTGKSIPWLHRCTLRHAHAIVANSREARDRLAVTYGVGGAHVRMIHNAVAAPDAPPADARTAMRREFDVSPATVVFVCTAMMRPEKGHGDLVRAVAMLDLDVPWELWFAGYGVELEPCRELVRQLRLESNVRFLGLRQDVARVYAGADIAVLASRSESLPNFLVEAQWMGLPVVAMDIAGVGETFAPDVSGRLIRPGDLRGFAVALGHLAHDAALRTSMAKAARAHAQREFDPAQQNQRYLDLFAELTSGRRDRD